MAEGWTVEADVALRLLLAVLLGGAVGLEREFRGRPAGLCTHILVCLGAAVIMISSTHLAALPPAFTSVSEVQVGPGRSDKTPTPKVTGGAVTLSMRRQPVTAAASRGGS